jgi:hypothetical protein
MYDAFNGELVTILLLLLTQKLDTSSSGSMGRKVRCL